MTYSDEELYFSDEKIEIENRIRNLMWTVGENYELGSNVDAVQFQKAKYIVLYDAMKQGAFAKYFDRDKLSLYLMKKIYLRAQEPALVMLSQMCIDASVAPRLIMERPGTSNIRKKAFEETLDKEFDHLSGTPAGRLKLGVIRQVLDGQYLMERRLEYYKQKVFSLGTGSDTMDVIRTIDELYNGLIDPGFESDVGGLEAVLAVTMEELSEYTWDDLLKDDIYEQTLEAYMKQMQEQIAKTAGESDYGRAEDEEYDEPYIVSASAEQLEKVHSYVELNYGKSYMSDYDAMRQNSHYCRGIHMNCSLYYTDGILQNPAIKNYKYAYAKKARDKNKIYYYDNHRVAKQNITTLSDLIRRAIVMRQQEETQISDGGVLIPARLWKVGRTPDAKLFYKKTVADNSLMVVDVLVDASGSQQVRQSQVALQSYIISEALSRVGIPHRVISFCTFWDHTIMQRFRDYDDDKGMNDRIFDYVTSSNNRDGLAIRAEGDSLLERAEDIKVLIILSDGRPYDVMQGRVGMRCPKPYKGKAAIRDAGIEIRRLRNEGAAVLGVFAGEDKDLEAEKKIFGKDFAYIRDISVFSKIVGNYLIKQLL